MATVTIRISSTNQFNVTPPVIVTVPTDLTVEWNIINNGSLVLLNPPIVFPWPVPSTAPPPVHCSSYSQFTGAVTPGPGTNKWQATMPSMPSHTTQCYKYSVVYEGGAYDPEVENQGVPPGGAPFPDRGKPEVTPGKGPDKDVGPDAKTE